MSKALIAKLKSGELPLDFNWNTEIHPEVPLVKMIPSEPTPKQILHIGLVSEDLRDGLHGVSQYPSVSDMMRYIDTLYSLGIRRITVGVYPGEKNKINASINEVLSQMRQHYPKAIPIVLCLATDLSVKWTINCRQINPNLEALVFMGTSPSRMLVEEWEQDYVLNQLAWAITEMKKAKIKVIGGTEHTTQTPPEFLKKIISTMVKSGASNFCIADTIGIARPIGAYRVIKFVKHYLKKIKAENVLVEWHGHRDMGNDVENAMVAISAGADLIHTVARGIGERTGNTPLEAVIINCSAILRDAKVKNPWKMEKLLSILQAYNEITHTHAPSHGVLGIRSHTTSLGIHTAAMLKAKKLARELKFLKEHTLAEKIEQMSRSIYTAVDPHMIGNKHTIHVGPWSGASTVIIANLELGGDPAKLSDATIQHILKTAKQLGRELTQEELKKLLAE